MTKHYIKEYPRPQFVRPDWELLNGEWDFAFDDEAVLPAGVEFLKKLVMLP